MLIKIVQTVHVFLIILSALTVQADDVSLKNPLKSKQPVKFRVVVPSTGYDRTVTLYPGESQNAIGTDLWHNAYVEITGLPSSPGAKDGCRLFILEKKLPWGGIFDLTPTFYLPQVEGKEGYRPCPYTSNLPGQCNCFKDDWCLTICSGISNAQVIVQMHK